MSNQPSKRGSGPYHYDGHPYKKHKPNDKRRADFTSARTNYNQTGHSNHKQHGMTQNHRNNSNTVLDHTNTLPEHTECEPCKLLATETDSGMIALLDKLEAEELAPQGDRNILHHARELRHLLSNRAAATRCAQMKEALDKVRPAKDQYVSIPKYIARKLELAKDLPPLPPITEPHLQDAVFTHVSSHGSSRIRGVNDVDVITYERLEFLGDAYIELISSRLIYSRLQHVDVPKQAHFREQLVRNETLAQFSNAYSLPDRLKHGGHMSEGKAWKKVVADVFEAYVAAVVLSDPQNGFETAEKWLTKLWTPQIMSYKEEMIENPRAKDDLSRLVESKGVKLNYREEKAMVHENGVQKYFMGVYLTGWGYNDELLGSGEGRNKAQAGVNAAANALQRNIVVLRSAAQKKQELTPKKKQEETESEDVNNRERDAINAKNETKTEGTLVNTNPCSTKDSSSEERKEKKKEKRERKERS